MFLLRVAWLLPARGAAYGGITVRGAVDLARGTISKVYKKEAHFLSK
ncbi:hypothetical protein A2U01_0027106, partial [Trifolium medium]|nr:hypothetical protein [Trifolium medium]